MSLDTLGRDAVAELERGVRDRVDPGDMRDRLDRRWRRRNRTRVVIMGATIGVIAAVGWGAIHSLGPTDQVVPANPSPNPTFAPTPSMHNGPVVIDTGGELWLAAADGDNVPQDVALPRHPGTPEPGYFGVMKWSRDGLVLMYSTPTEIRAFDTTTAQDRLLRECDRPCDFDLAPDGHTLAIASETGLILEDLLETGSSPPTTLLTHAVSDPAWSPDGSEIAVVTTPGDGVARSIAVVAVGTRSSRVVLESEPPGSGPALDKDLRSPLWSADGETLFFLASRSDGTSWLGMVPGSGGERTWVDQVSHNKVAYRDLALSPDGIRLLAVGGGGLAVADLVEGSTSVDFVEHWAAGMDRGAWRPVP